MQTVIEEKKTYTYEDYLKTPDDKRYELIEGDLIMTPSPKPYHQSISENIAFEIGKFVREKKSEKVFHSPCDVYFDDAKVLQPDILFISKDRLGIIGEKNIQGAPDLVIEILSESTAYRNLVKKKKIYSKFGVKEYWVVDPEEKTIEMYTLKDMVFVLAGSFSKNEILKSALLEGFTMNLEIVFAKNF